MRFLAAAGSVLLLLSAARAHGQDLTPVDQVEPPPPIRSGEVMPLRDSTAEALEADVVIQQKEGARVSVHRAGGQVRAVRIEPTVGPVYYLVDTDGDGNLDQRTNSLNADFLVNMWGLISW